MSAHTLPAVPSDTPTPPTLGEVVISLSMARGVDEITGLVRQAARPLVGADGITFILREGDNCYYAEEDAISPLWKGQRFPMERCISGWAMRHREIAVIEDIYADDRIPHAVYRPTFVRSLVMIPVREDDPVGAIGAYWARRRCPTTHEIQTLQHIANSASVAMTNVMLLNSLSQARDEADRAKDAIVLALAALAETRDLETGNHIRRTQHYVRCLAQAARKRPEFSQELDEATIDLLYKSAALHDIGKVGIPDRILLNAGRLEPAEFEIMKTHVDLPP